MRDQAPRPAVLQYLLLGAVAFVALMHFYLGVVDNTDMLEHGEQRSRVPFFVYGGPAVLRAHPEAINAGIQAGDLILDVAGQPLNSGFTLLQQIRHTHPGQSISVTYRSSGSTPTSPRTTVVKLAPERSGPTPAYAWVAHSLTLLLSLICLLTGIYVVLARPRSYHSWLILGVLSPFDTLFISTAHLNTPYHLLMGMWSDLSQTAMPVCLMLFGIYFPKRSALDVRCPWIKWVLLVPALLLFPTDLLASYANAYDFRSNAWLTPHFSALNRTENFFSVLSILYFFVCIGRKLATAKGDDRRRLRVLFAGCAAGFVPFFLLVLDATVRSRSLGEGLPEWVLIASFTIFLLLPLSLAYVVVVQRALDVRLLIRQGTKYFFARGTLYAITIVLTVWVSYSISVFASRAGHRRPGDLARVIVIAAVFLAFRFAFTQRLRSQIDRHFFREAYSAEQILSSFAEEARTFTEVTPLIEQLAECIDQALHVERVAVYIRKGDRFVLKLDRGTDSAPPLHALSIPASSLAGSEMKRIQVLRPISRNGSSVSVENAGPTEETILSALFAEMLVPLPGRQHIVGFFALGPKRSEEPYTHTDRQLLQGVATQAGLALENAELVQKLTTAVAQRERIAHEIEIAREVQERLLPQSYPTLASVDVAGYYRPAQVIGGDYYDVFLIPNTSTGSQRLALVLGDASGKGISAALMMASLRASLRTLAPLQRNDVAELVQHVSRLLYESSTSNRYATLFYAEYDPSSSVLTYVNAGHNPPALIRGSEVLRLDATGTVAGIFPDTTYTQVALPLTPGDVLLVFSDGISEAMNPGGEEWGEQKLINRVRALIDDAQETRTAEQYVASISKAVDEFAASAPQHDDMTILLFRLESTTSDLAGTAGRTHASTLIGTGA